MTHQKVRPDFPTAGETDSGRAGAADNQTVKACSETPKHCARQTAKLPPFAASACRQSQTRARRSIARPAAECADVSTRLRSIVRLNHRVARVAA